MTLLADQIESWIAARQDNGARILFISGAQGIGKTTALRDISQRTDNLAVLSLDDFYLNRTARTALATKVHPLFQTRGVPGTHDVDLFCNVLTELADASSGSGVQIPVFDKTIDDRVSTQNFRRIKGRPSLILVEGWMVGALPDPASPKAEPLNRVEADDRDGTWRAYQETQLAGPYARLWDFADAFLHVEAPGFEPILKWRIEQEETTLNLPKGTLPSADTERISRFILHYERLTRRMLDRKRRPGWHVPVDEKRNPNIDAVGKDA